VNRGVALYNDKIIVGLLDGRLVAFNKANGDIEWVQQTTPPGDYSITGAPRIAGDKVIIGNGGAEYGVRGYVTAYDADTGEQRWR
ncbi:MAG TPA: PQQ-dependent dehydrogenase, methanol/ethanol family, partial [Gemmatimonadetes bacterium]|nr:PQQ-dependent dehydrogenase, methanol/ethanol family [Gemmatimonadota bacterium]